MAALTQREYLVEMEVRTDGAGTLATLCYSVFGFNSEPFDAMPNRHYAPRIIRPGVLSMSLFTPGSTNGSSRIGFGGVELANTDGGLDGLLDYGFAGGTIRVLSAPVGSRYSDFTLLLTGVMDQPVLSWSSVSIAVRDRQNLLASKMLQLAQYAGTNTGSPLAGAEGTTADLKGKRKPLVLGRVNNVRAVCVNTDRNIYQVSDGAVNAITAVYVAGVAKTVGAVYADYATMESTAPTAGQFRALPGSGLFRLDAASSSEVTADVTQGAATANRTAAQLMSAIAQRAGIAVGDINAADVAGLDALCPQELGMFIESDQTISAAAAMDKVASSVGAWWAFDLTGKLKMGRLGVPSGSPVASFDASNILAIDRRRTSDQGNGVPAWRVTVDYAPNSTRQVAGLGSGIAAARLNYIGADSLNTTATDASVQAKYPLACEMTFATLMTTLSDASTEAARLLGIYGQRRDLLALRIRFDPALASALVLGSIVQVEVPRYGLDAGKLFLVIGYSVDYETDIIEFVLWG